MVFDLVIHFYFVYVVAYCFFSYGFTPGTILNSYKNVRMRCHGHLVEFITFVAFAFIRFIIPMFM